MSNTRPLSLCSEWDCSGVALSPSSESLEVVGWFPCILEELVSAHHTSAAWLVSCCRLMVIMGCSQACLPFVVVKPRCKSIIDISKMFEHIDMLSIGIQ